jgi:hypothetical protein
MDRMKITSIQTIPLEQEPLVALVPHLEVLASHEPDAGFTWRKGELMIADAPVPRGAAEILDLPYSLDRSAHLSGLASGEPVDFPQSRAQSATVGSLSLAGLPGFRRSSSWNVAAATRIGDGFAEVALAGPGGGAFFAATYEDDLPNLETGAPVLGIEGLLRSTEHTGNAGSTAVYTPVELGRKYVLRWLPVIVDFVPDQPPKPTNAWLPLARAHCPRKRECRAEFTAGHAATGGQTATIDVLGSGGTMTHEITLDESEGLSAEPEQCAELVVPGILLVESGTTRLAGDVVAYGLRLTMETIDKRDVHERCIPAEYDECGWEIDQLPSDAWRRDRTGVTSRPGEEPTFHREIEEETTGTLSIGLKLNQAPVSLGISFTRVATQRDSVSAWLAPGAAYAAYQPGADRTMEWC